MDLYVSQPRGRAANLPRALMRVAKLYRQRFLDIDSTVWINANTMSPLFWVHAHGRATCVWWFDAPTAGAVRITNGRIRWAPAAELTVTNPSIDLKLEDISILSDNTRLAVVIDHNFDHPDSAVGVYDGKRRLPVVGGYWESGPTAVVDLLHFDASQVPQLSPSRCVYETGMANFQGIDLLVQGMNAAASADVLDNTDAYRYQLSTEVLNRLADNVGEFEFMANAISSTLFGADLTDSADSDGDTFPSPAL